jgi:uncharacterized protein with PIN domain
VAAETPLARQAEQERRIVAPRDTRLKAKYPHIEVLLIDSVKPVEQLHQVRVALSLDLRQGLFARCLECNSEIQEVSKKEVEGQVPAYVFKTQ